MVRSCPRELSAGSASPVTRSRKDLPSLKPYCLKESLSPHSCQIKVLNNIYFKYFAQKILGNPDYNLVIKTKPGVWFLATETRGEIISSHSVTQNPTLCSLQHVHSLEKNPTHTDTKRREKKKPSKQGKIEKKSNIFQFL